ncbi:hypothetical protein [Brevibacillus laterosporus]|uniref:hypothetical protein n=1 Tax=Brevibacillus laterosporus TaxID=1465 RepID=UPI003D21FFD5
MAVKKKRDKLHLYPDAETYKRLDLIHKAIITKKSKVSIHDVAEDFLRLVVNTPEFITWIQNKYQVPGDHPMRILPVVENGRCHLRSLYQEGN